MKGKKVILAVTGSIAAYKAAFLCRLLKKEGAEVRVIMTEASRDFIGATTLATLSENPVYHSFYRDEESGEWNNHVELSLWADFLLVAPASAATLSRMAQGKAENFLIATYLSATCPVLIAPAMDRDMMQHEATQNNIKIITDRGAEIIPSEEGELASGLIGLGRMAEPENIVALLKKKSEQRLRGKQALVTAGPTQEAIDPVRFIGNRSSGKMGYAIAKELVDNGAEVVLVSGPTKLELNHPNLQRINVSTADEMYEACHAHFEKSDITVMTAAVADFKPEESSEHKIKKNGSAIELKMVPTRDILKSLGDQKRKGQLLVGFALETNNEFENARKKLNSKNLDFIVLNSLKDKGAGFKHDTNKITILNHTKNLEFELKSKQLVAKDIVDEIKNYFQK